MEVSLSDVWTAAGVVLGFQIGALAWRISRESVVGKTGDLVWLAPADYFNLIAIGVMVVGVFVAPALGLVDVPSIRKLFGLSTLLLFSHGAALAGHYDLYNPRTTRSYRWFPLQERVVVALGITAVVVYVVLAWGR